MTWPCVPVWSRNDAQLVAAFLANWQQVHDDGVGKHPEWQVAHS